MSDAFENAVIEEFLKLNHKNFTVNNSKHYFFVCGGPVNVNVFDHLSFRDRFFTFTASEESDIHDSLIMAENFKDYFKENAYKDLLTFEDDIASISTLVIIFLESPGSLVELGMFSSRANLYNKLVIVAPQDKIQYEDSFIYLGPIEHIRKKDPTSVSVYPWPDNNDTKYSNDNLIDLCENIKHKIRTLPKKMSFKSTNFGHISYLIHDIVNLCYPIMSHEIEFALEALDIKKTANEISRHIYLLTKLDLISLYSYSNFRYYYPKIPSLRTIAFGRNEDGKVVDQGSVKMKITQSYLKDEDPLSYKRQRARKLITKILDGERQ